MSERPPLRAANTAADVRASMVDSGWSSPPTAPADQHAQQLTPQSTDKRPRVSLAPRSIAARPGTLLGVAPPSDDKPKVSRSTGRVVIRSGIASGELADEVRSGTEEVVLAADHASNDEPSPAPDPTWSTSAPTEAMSTA